MLTLAQAALAFNLVCSGTMRTGPLGLAMPESGGAPFAIVYRIDLDARRWCAGACAASEAVAEIAFGRIVLRETHDPAGSHVVTFDPATRRFTDTLIEGDRQTLRSGICERAPFGGLTRDRQVEY